MDPVTVFALCAATGVASFLAGAIGEKRHTDAAERASYQKGKDDRDAEYIAMMQRRSRRYRFGLGDGRVGVVHPAGQMPVVEDGLRAWYGAHEVQGALEASL